MKWQDYISEENLEKCGSSWKKLVNEYEYEVLYSSDKEIALAVMSDGVCFINSISFDRREFGMGIRMAMARKIKSTDKVVVLSAYNKFSDKVMKLYGMEYCSVNNLYHKGV